MQELMAYVFEKLLLFFSNKLAQTIFKLNMYVLYKCV